MIRLWRLTHPRYAASAYSGEGAALAGGRWNPLGRRLVYTSEALSLAALELLVHLDAPTALASFVAVPAAVDPAQIETVPLAELPRGWDAAVAPLELAALGEQWAASGRSLALRVPSAVVQVECNVLLNPLHPAFAGVRVGPPEPWHYDRRLVKR